MPSILLYCFSRPKDPHLQSPQFSQAPEPSQCGVARVTGLARFVKVVQHLVAVVGAEGKAGTG